MRSEAKLGLEGQKRAANALRQIGVLMVEHIGTPFTIIKTGRNGWYRGLFGEKVSGDLHGHLKNGTCVLAEVKTILDRNLRWSDLREHQPSRLSQHAEHSISLLIWVHNSGIYIMDWKSLLASGFGKGRGITVEQAQTLALSKL